MQFDLYKNQSVLNHIQKISPNMNRKTSGELIIHCPFCDDAIRPNAQNHGHLYISVNSPVFHCFRCNASGTLISLLINTGFEDREALEYIGNFIKINFTKDYYKSRERKTVLNKSKIILNHIYKLNIEFKRNFNNLYDLYRNYIFSRIGTIDFFSFLLSPGIDQNKILFCGFNNYDGENVLIRYLDLAAKKRYQINKNSTNLYYFQNLDFDKYNKITIAEGPFNIINLSLYNTTFNNNLFISINGKNYIGNIEKLILTYLLIGKYEISIVLDDDFVDKFIRNKYLKNLKNIIDIYNREILIKVYKPLIKNTDVGDFPGVVQI